MFIASVKANLAKRNDFIYMYSRNQHDIYDVSEQFISTFNISPLIKKCNKLITWSFVLNQARTIKSFFVVIQMTLILLYLKIKWNYALICNIKKLNVEIRYTHLYIRTQQ